MYYSHYILSIFCFILFNQNLLAKELTSYQLGIGDEIKIQVYGDIQLSIETKIDETGAIVYPYMGKIQISKLTLAQLEEKITDFLKGDYLINPIVDASIRNHPPFYLQGAVNQPGQYPYQIGLTVQTAISLGGGLNERASKRKIYIIYAKQQGHKRSKVPFKERISPGDIIIVDESFF